MTWQYWASVVVVYMLIFSSLSATLEGERDE